MPTSFAVGMAKHANCDAVDDLLAANGDFHGEGRSSKAESDDDELESSSVDEHVKAAWQPHLRSFLERGVKKNEVHGSHRRSREVYVRTPRW